MREAIESFKEVSGKPVIAHIVYPTDKDLYLASAADKIIMNPEGLIMNAGMASEPIFFAGFFEKYGIGVQVTKAGEFKSAAESFLLKRMSAPLANRRRPCWETCGTSMWTPCRAGRI